MDGSRLWIALVHHPVLDREGGCVTTSVTNLDVHDLARSARTYHIAGLVIVTPIEAQLKVVNRILEYWNVPEHAARIPRRREALALVHARASIEDARLLAGGDGPPRVIGTSARPGTGRRSWDEMRSIIRARPLKPRLILLGTGWGLADEALACCDEILEPIEGAGDYNHLSVRSAGAIVLDRLLGSKGPEEVGP